MAHKSAAVIATANPDLVLRRLVPAGPDWRLMARWLSDPRILEWWEGRDKPYDYERAAAKWSAAEIAQGHLDCRIMELAGSPIGYLQFFPVAKAEDYELDTAEKTWGIDLFIGEPGYWERGHGTAVVRAVVEHLLGNGAARVVIDPRVDNPRAIRTYEKVGFHKVKVLKEHEDHEGAKRDNWLMEIVAPD
ncbi:MAG: acetyltransferase [Dehalococcoidia bacterium]|nr:acetyltransferase [Dehalococcoidia bacterium]MCA9843628.1 acetyltransferase [Dehalococcoidia bacterium]MCA9853027.1 acetyltransferase [Dehalococcoidia bacterium]